jgi:hypothetical protein
VTTPSAPEPYQIIEAVTVKLDGSGNGTVRWTPGLRPTGANAGGASPGRNSGYQVAMTSVAVSVVTNTAEATAKTYISYGIQSNSAYEFIGQTQLGSTGDTCSITATLRPGDWITTVWAGGDANAIATMTIQGSATPPGVT